MNVLTAIVLQNPSLQIVNKLYHTTFITAASKFETTPSSSGLDLSTPGRWYVNIDGAVVDEYTRKQDVKNETADELNSRMEELEEKANEMQEQTNARLQQISVLLEKAMQHRSVLTIGDGQKQ